MPKPSTKKLTMSPQQPATPSERIAKVIGGRDASSQARAAAGRRAAVRKASRGR
ncbi:hypothetical protein M8Z33_07505 [Streptomyces sp. ZAF1911]|uniref:hypothetical protein n=1 Tax=Streptomyces sp. ZAF1911 TaxID=2944129 RepID=UPI00237C1F21|nr:hypothetical protein [Streptomyces sp. ZAF1911]MDD9376520.1 hypothetical protein [Streptomyces sp. ZAF1911]